MVDLSSWWTIGVAAVLAEMLHPFAELANLNTAIKIACGTPTMPSDSAMAL
jgi:hypothetical protein